MGTAVVYDLRGIVVAQENLDVDGESVCRAGVHHGGDLCGGGGGGGFQLIGNVVSTSWSWFYCVFTYFFYMIAGVLNKTGIFVVIVVVRSERVKLHARVCVRLNVSIT